MKFLPKRRGTCGYTTTRIGVFSLQGQKRQSCIPGLNEGRISCPFPSSCSLMRAKNIEYIAQWNRSPAPIPGLQSVFFFYPQDVLLKSRGRGSTSGSHSQWIYHFANPRSSKRSPAIFRPRSQPLKPPGRADYRRIVCNELIVYFRLFKALDNICNYNNQHMRKICLVALLAHPQ